MAVILPRQQFLHVSTNPLPKKRTERQTERKGGEIKKIKVEEDTKASNVTVNAEGSKGGAARETQRTERRVHLGWMF